MLNYIRAELWKVFRRKYFYVVTALLLAGVVYSCFGVWVPAGETLTENLVELLLPTLSMVGLVMVLAVEDMVFHDQYKLGTLKNEVVYGVLRIRIYLGKEFAAAVVGIVCAGLVLGTYLVLASVLPGAARGEELARELSEAAFQILCALPLWLGALGLAHLLYILLPSGIGAAITYLVALGFMWPVAEIIMRNTDRASDVYAVVETLRLLTLIGPFELLLAMTGVGRYLLFCWAVGMGWFWGCTVVGILGFRRREIR